MTDKIQSGTCCPYPQGEDPCFSVYHSCANIVITGSQSVDSYAAAYKYNGISGPYTQESIVRISECKTHSNLK
jgi:hypothetical protein